MTRKLSITMSLLLLVAVMALPAGAATIPSEEDFYLRSSSAETCADQVLTLSTRAGSGESVCGYRNGAPFGEVYQQTGLSDGTKVFSGNDGLPVVVDASRDVTGTITVGAYLSGVGGGVGQLVLDIDLSAYTGSSTISLGSVVAEQDLDPAKDEHQVPFTIDLPDGVDAQEIAGLNIAVDVRGVHMNHGFISLDGMSKFTLPILIEDTAV